MWNFTKNQVPNCSPAILNSYPYVVNSFMSLSSSGVKISLNDGVSNFIMDSLDSKYACEFFSRSTAKMYDFFGLVLKN